MAWHRKPGMDRNRTTEEQSEGDQIKAELSREQLWGALGAARGGSALSAPTQPCRDHGSQRGQTAQGLVAMATVPLHITAFLLPSSPPAHTRTLQHRALCLLLYSPFLLFPEAVLFSPPLSAGIKQNATKKWGFLKHRTVTWWAEACFPLHHGIPPAVKLHRALAFV